MPDTNTNDIDALLRMLEGGGWVPPNWSHAALTALVAERDELKEENNALRSWCKAHQDELLDRVFEMDALRQRIAELEANPPADRDRDLRERWLRGEASDEEMAAAWARAEANKMIAAMRKGGGA